MSKRNLIIGVIATFLITFFTLRACEASTIELGSSIATDWRSPALVYTESLGKWDLGVALIGPQSWDNVTAPINGTIFAQRIVKKGGFSMGLGGATWIKTSRLIGCPIGYTLSLAYDLTKRFGLHYRHWSNGGTCAPNRGQDLLSFGVNF